MNDLWQGRCKFCGTRREPLFKKSSYVGGGIKPLVRVFEYECVICGNIKKICKEEVNENMRNMPLL